jgi:hypothetical protein
VKGKIVGFGAILLAAAVPALSTAAGLTHAPTAHIAVRPSTGSPATTFLVTFRAPQRTGRHGGTERRYQLSATGPVGASGCASIAEVSLPSSRAHARVHVKLDPAHFGGRWCPGTFRGQVEEVERPVCPRGKVCPAFVVLLGTVGRFSFHVKPAGGDTRPPVFTGLGSAFACTPGPQRPGETTPFTLSWNSATDDVTPSSQIVYDVYVSTMAGAENFSKPTWTTPPGVTTFKTPGLPSHGTFFFVVRARDQAGNEDQNRVERRGVDPCL